MWNWLGKYLLEVGALQRVLPVVSYKAVQTVERPVLRQVIFDLASFLLGLDTTVMHLVLAPDNPDHKNEPLRFTIEFVTGGEMCK